MLCKNTDHSIIFELVAFLQLSDFLEIFSKFARQTHSLKTTSQQKPDGKACYRSFPENLKNLIDVALALWGSDLLIPCFRILKSKFSKENSSYEERPSLGKTKLVFYTIESARGLCAF